MNFETYLAHVNAGKVVTCTTIGERAIVATSTVVTSDMTPCTIVGGLPARYIKDAPLETE